MRESFISEARRGQIAEAAILTLHELGYARASLARIAKRAGISAGLISYHFDDKRSLMDYVLAKVLADADAFVRSRIGPAATYREKLHAFLRGSLAYFAEHPDQYTALIEIVFRTETPEGVPYYRLDGGDEDEPLLHHLLEILMGGQTHGEFRSFNVRVMAAAIQGAIWECASNPAVNAERPAVQYGDELVQIFDRATRP